MVPVTCAACNTGHLISKSMIGYRKLTVLPIHKLIPVCGCRKLTVHRERLINRSFLVTR